MDTSSVRRSEYIFDEAVAVRGRPLRRLPATAERTAVSAFFVERTGTFALCPIDILVYELLLAKVKLADSSVWLHIVCRWQLGIAIDGTPTGLTQLAKQDRGNRTPLFATAEKACTLAQLALICADQKIDQAPGLFF